MATRSEFTPVEELLHEDWRTLLSDAAQKLYSLTWNLMRRHRKLTFVLTDQQASNYARVPIQFIEGARRELVEAGLLLIDPHNAIKADEPVYRFAFIHGDTN